MIINFSQDTSVFLHMLLQWLGITIGFQIYNRTRKKNPNVSIDNHSWIIFIMALSGAGLGLKLGSFIEDPTYYLSAQSIQDFHNLIVSGGTITGAILGAYCFIEFYKKIFNIKKSTGDYLVFGLMFGIAIGRVGCFLAGKYDATYGNPTDLFIGVDFGEGIKRHPTQIYEIIYLSILAVIMTKMKPTLSKIDGLTFKFFAANYFLWRLIIDGFKPITYFYDLAGLSLSGIQVISLIAVIHFYGLIYTSFRRMNNV